MAVSLQTVFFAARDSLQRRKAAVLNEKAVKAMRDTQQEEKGTSRLLSRAGIRCMLMSWGVTVDHTITHGTYILRITLHGILGIFKVQT